jgi:hypothetical protein
MFPLSFPLSILAERATPGDCVVDPFCGRGTTTLAARLCGLRTVGIDSSQVAAAVSQSKLADVGPAEIMAAAEDGLDQVTEPPPVPEGEFWSLGFHPTVLRMLCRFRAALLQDCSSSARRALRAIILGSLHGPRGKLTDSYFSNQCPRTYAPKPRYAVSYWKSHGLEPPEVDVIEIIRKRAERYYGVDLPPARGAIVLGDSRDPAIVSGAMDAHKADWIITSPPYYGLRTYTPDQWLRHWFLGGAPEVDYTSNCQIRHRSPDAFVGDLARVWNNLRAVCSPRATMVVRFGGIRDRKVEPLPLLLGSLERGGWHAQAVSPAGLASDGKRQALHFRESSPSPLDEHDVWAVQR